MAISEAWRRAGKTIRSYVLLVLLPFAAVLAILRLGARLRAPASIAGTWAARLSVDSGGGRPASPDAGAGIDIRIRQSGSYIGLELGDADRWTGRLAGATLDAEGHPPASLRSLWGNLNPRGRVHLRAVVHRSMTQVRLRGTLRASGCTHCPVVEVVALRTPPVLGAGSR